MFKTWIVLSFSVVTIAACSAQKEEPKSAPFVPPENAVQLKDGGYIYPEMKTTPGLAGGDPIVEFTGVYHFLNSNGSERKVWKIPYGKSLPKKLTFDQVHPPQILSDGTVVVFGNMSNKTLFFLTPDGVKKGMSILDGPSVDYQAFATVDGGLVVNKVAPGPEFTFFTNDGTKRFSYNGELLELCDQKPLFFQDGTIVLLGLNKTVFLRADGTEKVVWKKDDAKSPKVDFNCNGLIKEERLLQYSADLSRLMYFDSDGMFTYGRERLDYETF